MPDITSLPCYDKLFHIGSNFISFLSALLWNVCCNHFFSSHISFLLACLNKRRNENSWCILNPKAFDPFYTGQKCCLFNYIYLKKNGLLFTIFHIYILVNLITKAVLFSLMINEIYYYFKVLWMSPPLSLRTLSKC